MSEQKKQSGKSKYDPAYIEQGYFLSRDGKTDVEMARFWKVSRTTLTNWKKAHPAFAEALKKGKDEFDTGVVEVALHARAVGYSHPEEKVYMRDGEPQVATTVKYYPPDVTSAIFWLKNRNPERWRDKQDLDVSGPTELEDDEIANRLQALLSQTSARISEETQKPEDAPEDRPEDAPKARLQVGPKSQQETHLQDFPLLEAMLKPEQDHDEKRDQETAETDE